MRITEISTTNIIVTPIALYASTPIMNMDLNLQNAPDFKFSPDKSFSLLLPSFIRTYLSSAEVIKKNMDC